MTPSQTRDSGNTGKMTAHVQHRAPHHLAAPALHPVVLHLAARQQAALVVLHLAAAPHQAQALRAAAA